MMFSYRCRAPSGQLDSDEDIYERRSRAHTDFLCTKCEMGVLYDNYGIIGDIIVRIPIPMSYWSNYSPFIAFHK